MQTILLNENIEFFEDFKRLKIENKIESNLEVKIDWTNLYYLIESKKYFSVLAKKEDKIVVYVSYVSYLPDLSPDGEYRTKLNGIYITKDFRRQGIATALLNYDFGTKFCYCSIPKHNRASRILHKKVGFSVLLYDVWGNLKINI